MFGRLAPPGYPLDTPGRRGEKTPLPSPISQAIYHILPLDLDTLDLLWHPWLMENELYGLGVSAALAEIEGWPSWTVGHAKWCKSLAQFAMSPRNCTCGETPA